MRRLKRTTLTLCTIVLAGTSLAGAAIEVFDFSGTIQHTQDRQNLLGGVDKGTEFRGTYWIDTDKLNEVQNSLRQKKSYESILFEGDDCAFGMTVMIGEYTFTSGGSSNPATITSLSHKKQDSYTVYAYAGEPGNTSTEYVGLSITAKGGTLNLNSDPLLIEGVDLNDKHVKGNLTFVHNDNQFRGKSHGYAYAVGEMDSFSHIRSGGTTPEPGTLALLVFGGSVLFYRHKRKQVTVS